MKPVSQRRIDIATKAGLAHAYVAALACREAGLPFPVACALLSKESGGRNIYGHDRGGVFSTNGRSVTIQGKTYAPGADIEVTASNCAAFLWQVGGGALSNGVGPCQITYKGYFPQMLDQDMLPWDPHDNMLFGFRILAANYARTKDWARAFGHYNGGGVPDMTYGNSAKSLLDTWKARFA